MKPNQDRKRLSSGQALSILTSEDLIELGKRADNIRKDLHPGRMVTFVIDRNINYTNICINKCTFCAFWRDERASDAYLLDETSLFRKIEETIQLGGTQILLQGGLHPALSIDYYTNLLTSIKKRFNIHVHGFSPPEISFIADASGLSIRETLTILKRAGLDSIPGGGAEILSDRIRDSISPKKIKSSRWLEVMEKAHQIGMRTTATMMFGSVESTEDIILHLEAVRSLQDRTGGFTAFIPWPFQPGNTELSKSFGKKSRRPGRRAVDYPATAVEYLKVLALSRIYLDNIDNIQASWVTQGIKLAQVALRFGANDLGSTMIEENVVASAGVSHKVSKAEMIRAIKDAGFRPVQRDTYYSVIKRF